MTGTQDRLDTARTDMIEAGQGTAMRIGTAPERSAHPHGIAATVAMADRPKRAGPPADGGREGTGTAVLTRTRTRKPNLYRVLLLNDDYTPMEFVVHVLERFFNKDRAEATRIMMHVHQNGVGECGVFTYEVAETKVTLVMDLARKHMHPLQCVMEKK
ncbi:ATP-dependent Clp protease adapter protein ClpS [Bosea minatitlanensis]